MTNRQKSKTALVLSGGGSRGAYEAGVWQALVDLGIKIDIVTGSSVGGHKRSHGMPGRSGRHHQSLERDPDSHGL